MSDRAWVAAFLRRYDALDKALVAAGFPATSTWWRAEIERFFQGGCRRWVIRAGRRAGKSSTLCRLAVAWALYGSWSVPLGDVAVIPFVSVSKDEASARLRTIAAILRTLGVTFEERADELEITGTRPALFKVLACNTSAVVGFTSIAVLGDEVSKWESRDTGANPAREVVGSLSPTMATQRNAFLVLSSSPWSLDDFHCECFNIGATEHQTVSYCPTWIGNPTISEAQTHADEPNEREWRRAYLAEPSQSVASAFDPDHVTECFNRKPRGSFNYTGWIAIDPSNQTAKGDGFGWCLGATTDADEIVVGACGEFTGTTPLKEIVTRLSQLARDAHTNVIYSDQRESSALGELFSREGITLSSHAWTEGTKAESVAMIARWLAEQRLLVEGPGADRMRSEMLRVKARELPGGRTHFGLNGLDTVSCLVSLATASIKGAFKIRQGNALLDALAREVNLAVEQQDNDYFSIRHGLETWSMR